MRFKEWIETQEKFNSYSCVKHRSTKELNISGTRGEIWEDGENKLKAVFKIGTNLLKIELPTDFESETLFAFGPDKFQTVLEIIDAPDSSQKQAVYANRFARH